MKTVKYRRDKFLHWDNCSDYDLYILQNVKQKKLLALVIVNATYCIITAIAVYFTVYSATFSRFAFIVGFMLVLVFGMNLFLRFIYRRIDAVLEEYLERRDTING